MPRFTVTQNYSAERAAASVTQFGPWNAGETVELDEPDAAWVNADSPGTLEAAKPAKAAAKKSAPAKDD